MSPEEYHHRLLTRRHCLRSVTSGIGYAALASLLNSDLRAAGTDLVGATPSGATAFPAITPKAKRVIYLFQSGGPSQMDLFDFKPTLVNRHGEELPDSIRRGQRYDRWSRTFSCSVLAVFFCTTRRIGRLVQ